jgi:hypothetical protein
MVKEKNTENDKTEFQVAPIVQLSSKKDPRVI